MTPRSATAAPSTAALSDAPANARRGGSATPVGTSASESTMTPSARESDGPGTNVRDTCGGRRGRPGLAGIVTRTFSSSVREVWVVSRAPSAKKESSGFSLALARAPRTRISRIQSTPRSSPGIWPQFTARPRKRLLGVGDALGRKCAAEEPRRIVVEPNLEPRVDGVTHRNQERDAEQGTEDGSDQRASRSPSSRHAPRAS